MKKLIGIILMVSLFISGIPEKSIAQENLCRLITYRTGADATKDSIFSDQKKVGAGPDSAFFGNTNNDQCWIAGRLPTAAIPVWLNYRFGTLEEHRKQIEKVRIYAKSDSALDYWSFHGSQDSIIWRQLYPDTDDSTFSRYRDTANYETHTFNNDTAYQYYSIQVDLGYAIIGRQYCIHDVEMFERTQEIETILNYNQMWSSMDILRSNSSLEQDASRYVGNDTLNIFSTDDDTTDHDSTIIYNAWKEMGLLFRALGDSAKFRVIARAGFSDDGDLMFVNAGTLNVTVPGSTYAWNVSNEIVPSPHIYFKFESTSDTCMYQDHDSTRARIFGKFTRDRY